MDTHLATDWAYIAVSIISVCFGLQTTWIIWKEGILRKNVKANNQYGIVFSISSMAYSGIGPMYYAVHFYWGRFNNNYEPNWNNNSTSYEL